MLFEIPGKPTPPCQQESLCTLGAYMEPLLYVEIQGYFWDDKDLGRFSEGWQDSPNVAGGLLIGKGCSSF